MFKKNLDTSGRLTRLSLGLLLLVIAIWLKSWLAFALSLFTFFEAYMSWCIVYQFLGINHCPTNKK